MLELCLILVGALALIGVASFAWSRLRGEKMTAGEHVETPHAENPDECCGMHAVCEKTTTAALNGEIIYYDDDQLDVFVGRPADAYDDDEIEQFRDVLITLQPHDAPGWSQSLQMRGIALPASLADELQILIADI